MFSSSYKSFLGAARENFEVNILVILHFILQYVSIAIAMLVLVYSKHTFCDLVGTLRRL